MNDWHMNKKKPHDQETHSAKPNTLLIRMYINMNIKNAVITVTLSIIAALGGYIAYPLLHPAPSETAATNDIEIVPATPNSSESTTITLNKADAEKWLSDFRNARDKANDALFLNDAEKRPLHTPVVMELVDRAEHIFGEGSECAKAAGHLNGAWMLEVFLMLNPSRNTNINLSGAMGLAWEGGQVYGDCRDIIDNLK